MNLNKFMDELMYLKVNNSNDLKSIKVKKEDCKIQDSRDIEVECAYYKNMYKFILRHIDNKGIEEFINNNITIFFRKNHYFNRLQRKFIVDINIPNNINMNEVVKIVSQLNHKESILNLIKQNIYYCDVNNRENLLNKDLINLFFYLNMNYNMNEEYFINLLYDDHATLIKYILSLLRVDKKTTNIIINSTGSLDMFVEFLLSCTKHTKKYNLKQIITSIIETNYYRNFKDLDNKENIEKIILINRLLPNFKFKSTESINNVRLGFINKLLDDLYNHIRK